MTLTWVTVGHGVTSALWCTVFLATEEMTADFKRARPTAILSSVLSTARKSTRWFSHVARRTMVGSTPQRRSRSMSSRPIGARAMSWGQCLGALGRADFGSVGVCRRDAIDHEVRAAIGKPESKSRLVGLDPEGKTGVSRTQGRNKARYPRAAVSGSKPAGTRRFAHTGTETNVAKDMPPTKTTPEPISRSGQAVTPKTSQTLAARIEASAKTRLAISSL